MSAFPKVKSPFVRPHLDTSSLTSLTSSNPSVARNRNFHLERYAKRTQHLLFLFIFVFSTLAVLISLFFPSHTSRGFASSRLLVTSPSPHVPPPRHASKNKARGVSACFLLYGVTGTCPRDGVCPFLRGDQSDIETLSYMRCGKGWVGH